MGEYEACFTPKTNSMQKTTSEAKAKSIDLNTSSSSIQIFVRNLAGKDLAVRVDPFDLVDRAKNTIYKKEGVPQHE